MAKMLRSMDLYAKAKTTPSNIQVKSPTKREIRLLWLQRRDVLADIGLMGWNVSSRSWRESKPRGVEGRLHRVRTAYMKTGGEGDPPEKNMTSSRKLGNEILALFM